MSDVVRIELDRRDPIYRAGEVVSGTVVLDGAAGRRARKVVLRTWWETRGRGTSVRGGKRAVVLHEGPPPEGGTHRHPFRFVAPDGPFTYRGHHLAVEHVLQALIELPLAPDAEVELPFRLIPGTSVAPVPDDLLAADGSSPAPPRRDRKAATFGVVLLGLGIVTLPVPGVFLVMAGLVVVGLGLRKEIAASRAGKVSVEVEPRIVAPGDELNLEIGIFPPKPVAIQGVAASLRAREICESGSGKNRKVHRHVVHVDEKALTGAAVLPGQLKRTLSVSFDVPDLGVWSFKAHRNEIRWDVVVQVRIQAWPDWIGEVPVVVWPARRLAAAETPAVIAGATPPPSGADPAPARGVAEPPAPASLRRRPLPPAPRSPSPSGPAPSPDPASSPRPASSTEGASSSEPTSSPPPASSRGPASSPEPLSSPAPTSRPFPTSPPSPRGNPKVREPHEAGSGRGRGSSFGSGAGNAPGPATESGPRPDAFATAVQAVLATRSHSPERKAALAALMGTPVAVDLVVDRIDRPFGRTRVAGFEGGWIVKGRLIGSELAVEARVPTLGAERFANLERGGRVRVQGAVSGWERLPERPVIRCAAADGE